MTDDVTARLAAIEQRANAATEGPWQLDGPHYWSEDKLANVVTTKRERFGVAVEGACGGAGPDEAVFLAVEVRLAAEALVQLADARDHPQKPRHVLAGMRDELDVGAVVAGLEREADGESTTDEAAAALAANKTRNIARPYTTDDHLQDAITKWQQERPT